MAKSSNPAAAAAPAGVPASRPRPTLNLIVPESESDDDFEAEEEEKDPADVDPEQQDEEKEDQTQERTSPESQSQSQSESQDERAAPKRMPHAHPLSPEQHHRFHLRHRVPDPLPKTSRQMRASHVYFTVLAEHLARWKRGSSPHSPIERAEKGTHTHNNNMGEWVRSLAPIERVELHLHVNDGANDDTVAVWAKDAGLPADELDHAAHVNREVRAHAQLGLTAPQSALQSGAAGLVVGSGPGIEDQFHEQHPSLAFAAAQHAGIGAATGGGSVHTHQVVPNTQNGHNTDNGHKPAHYTATPDTLWARTTEERFRYALLPRCSQHVRDLRRGLDTLGLIQQNVAAAMVEYTAASEKLERWRRALWERVVVGWNERVLRGERFRLRMEREGAEEEGVFLRFAGRQMRRRAELEGAGLFARRRKRLAEVFGRRRRRVREELAAFESVWANSNRENTNISDGGGTELDRDERDLRSLKERITLLSIELRQLHLQRKLGTDTQGEGHIAAAIRQRLTLLKALRQERTALRKKVRKAARRRAALRRLDERQAEHKRKLLHNGLAQIAKDEENALAAQSIDNDRVLRWRLQTHPGRDGGRKTEEGWKSHKLDCRMEYCVRFLGWSRQRALRDFDGGNCCRGRALLDGVEEGYFPQVREMRPLAATGTSEGRARTQAAGEGMAAGEEQALLLAAGGAFERTHAAALAEAAPATRLAGATSSELDGVGLPVVQADGSSGSGGGMVGRRCWATPKDSSAGFVNRRQAAMFAAAFKKPSVGEYPLEFRLKVREAFVRREAVRGVAAEAEAEGDATVRGVVLDDIRDAEDAALLDNSDGSHNADTDSIASEVLQTMLVEDEGGSGTDCEVESLLDRELLDEADFGDLEIDAEVDDVNAHVHRSVEAVQPDANNDDGVDDPEHAEDNEEDAEAADDGGDTPASKFAAEHRPTSGVNSDAAKDASARSAVSQEVDDSDFGEDEAVQEADEEEEDSSEEEPDEDELRIIESNAHEMIGDTNRNSGKDNGELEPELPLFHQHALLQAKTWSSLHENEEVPIYAYEVYKVFTEFVLEGMQNCACNAEDYFRHSSFEKFNEFFRETVKKRAVDGVDALLEEVRVRSEEAGRRRRQRRGALILLVVVLLLLVWRVSLFLTCRTSRWSTQVQLLRMRRTERSRPVQGRRGAARQHRLKTPQLSAPRKVRVSLQVTLHQWIVHFTQLPNQ